MKTKFKALFGVLLALVCGAAGIYYMQQPLAVAAQAVTQGELSETLSVQGKLIPKQSVVVNANATGVVRLEGELFPGKTVKADAALAQIDNSLVRRQMENQIKTLELQKSAIYSQNNTTGAELDLRVEQLQTQLTTAQQEYDAMFGKDGTAKSLLSIARESYLLSRRNYKDAKEYYDELEDDSVYDSGEFIPGKSEMYALRNQMNIAQQNVIIAQGNSSATTQAYYEDMIASCELQLELLGGSKKHSQGSLYAAAQQLQVTIDDLQSRLEPAAITAPAGGVIWELYASDGEYVAENMPVAKIYQPGSIKIEALVPSQDALALRVGDEAECRLADGSGYPAKVTFISPVAQEKVSGIGLIENRCAVELEVQGLPDSVGAGHQVDVDFSFLKAQDALSVPSGAIVPYGDGSGVYVVREGAAALVPVETGVSCAGRTEILSGVSQGEQIISDPYDAKLKEGGRVAPRAD